MEKSFEQIGNALNITKERAGQIHKRIINNFRKRINKREKTASILAG